MCIMSKGAKKICLFCTTCLIHIASNNALSNARLAVTVNERVCTFTQYC